MTRRAGPLLEIAANSLASALAAQDGGADRIELCGALELGGLTPSHGVIALARERVRIPLYVLIRPRAGDFVYDESEIEAMRRDVELCASLGCDGVVIGALDEAGSVDVARCRLLIDAAGGRGVTFHRAFDVCRDRLRTLDAICALGCERVLTSGGEANALSGAAAVRALIEHAAGRIAIMAGGGVDEATIGELRERTGAREFHASAKRRLPSRAPSALAERLGMGAGELRSDVDSVRALVAALREA